MPHSPARQQRSLAVTALVVAVLCAVLFPLGVVQAATPPPGTQIDIPEATSIGATIWNGLTVYVIPIGGVIGGLAGFGMMYRRGTARDFGPGATVAASGGAQFIPSFIGGAQRAAPAATADWHTPAHGFLAWLQGFTGQALVVDPVVLVVAGLTLLVLMRVSQRKMQVV